MFYGLTGWHLLILVAVLLLLFGATRLPALARSLGQSARILKREIRSVEEMNPLSDVIGKEAGGESVAHRPPQHSGDSK